MKKMKMFFAAAALTLITVGVFAGKAKFTTYTLEAYNNSVGGYTALTGSGVTLTNFQAVSSTTEPIIFNGAISTTTQYTLYAYNGTSYLFVQAGL